MKSVLVLFLLAGSVSASGATPTLREHMTAMGYILDAVWVASAEQKTYATAADKTAELRDHLTKAIAILPSSIENLNPNQRRAAVIEYHQLMARTIHLSGTLEQTLLNPDIDPISGSRQRDVQNLLREISVVVGRGHGRFRGR